VNQLGLWDMPKQTDASLMNAVDTLRERYGKNSIIRASDLKYHKPDNVEDK
jgi:hypothetical protein